MFKRFVTSTLMIGAAMSILPALASAQEFRGERIRYEDRFRGRREFRERFRPVHGRGFYDRFGCWHRY